MNHEMVDGIVIGPDTLFICKACIKNSGINGPFEISSGPFVECKTCSHGKPHKRTDLFKMGMEKYTSCWYRQCPEAQSLGNTLE